MGAVQIISDGNASVNGCEGGGGWKGDGGLVEGEKASLPEPGDDMRYFKKREDIY